jgi:5'-nucleotidase
MISILISNDDGIQAKGIQTLIKHLSPLYDVYVVAPAREQSAMGHALTLNTPLRVDEYPMEHPVKVAYAVSGTPSDCVKLALSQLLPTQIDVVISGINHGPNLGRDVVYSGTVSAALEGSLFGKRSIAVSLLNGHVAGANFHPSATFIAQNLDHLLTLPVAPDTILNINTPAVPLADFCGVKVCELGSRMYIDSYEQRQDPRGVNYYWLAGELVAHATSTEVDVEAIRCNYVTLTPLHVDLCNHQALATLRTVQTQQDLPNKTLF